MRKFKFESDVTFRGNFPLGYSKETISNEPMFYRADLDFAYRNGGICTRNFIANLPSDWLNCPVTIDSRVHMLMPGWYPCIPGWHHDDIPRTRMDGQPNYAEPEYDAKHLIGLVNAEIAPTEFAVGSVELEEVPAGELVYREWHKEIDKKVKEGKLQTYKAESGTMLQFNSHSFHQGTEAVKSGWRWFIRVSKDTPRALDCKNEIRKQTQVYMKDPMQGW